MQFPLCDKYGFGNSGLRELRLSLLRLSQDDVALATILHQQVLLPNVESIVDGFYAFLQGHPDASGFIRDSEVLGKLKQTHAEYLRSFAVDFHSAEYFENRLVIGLAHERIRLPLTVYLGAYSLLQSLIIRHIPDSLRRDDNTFLALIDLIQKVSMLDMSLATETYEQAQTSSLRSMLVDMYREREVLAQQAHMDDLTDLPNRKYWLEVLEREMKRCVDAGLSMSIAMIDLDHFKEINDQYGHLVGDNVLRDASATMQTVIRDMDILARFGGEEFVLLMPVTGLATAMTIVERMRKKLVENPLQINGYTIPVTFSAGVVQFNGSEPCEALIERADQAMYSAKQKGRNRTEY